MENGESLSPLEIEGNNLIRILSLIIQKIKTVAQTHGRHFSEDSSLLKQLLNALERVICHGLRQRRIQPLPDPWPVIQLLDKERDDAADILATVRGFSEVTSSLGRLRLWLRLSIMQKHLASYFSTLTESTIDSKLRDHYYNGALLLTTGHTSLLSKSLLELGVIECNFVLKGRNMSDYDTPLGVINYSQFLPTTLSHIDQNTAANCIKTSENHGCEDSCVQVNLIPELNHTMGDENKRLCSIIESLQLTLSQKNSQISHLEDKCEGQEKIFEEMEFRMKTAIQEKRVADELSLKMRQEICHAETKCAESETLLKIQSEKKNSFQKDLTAYKTKETKWIAENGRLREELESVKQSLASSQQIVSEQEMALGEMAEQVRTAKLQCDKLTEQQAAMEEAQWADDTLITHCQQCQKLFSLSLRKHHCRHCGNIFCHECSSNRLCLPSSAKPVRVCDSCHNIILQRYTSKCKLVTD